MNIGAPEILLLGVLGLMAIAPLVLAIVVAVDASRLPETAFERAGTSKTLWIVLPIVGIFTCGIISIVAAILWFATYKPKVARAASNAAPWPAPR